MAKRLTKVATVLGATALLFSAACSEGSGSSGDGDGDTGDGDGDEVGDGDGDTGDGDGDTGDGDGDTGDGDGDTGDGDGDEPGPVAGVTVAFDTGLEGLELSWEEPDTWSANNGMGGAGFNSTLEWNSDDGDPDAGSAQINTPFDYTGTGMDTDLRKVQVQMLLDSPVDLTGGLVSARAQLVSGATEECPFNAKIFVKTGAEYVWGNGDIADLAEGVWTDLTFNIAIPNYTNDGFDASEVVSIGVEVSPNNAETCTTDDAVVLLDTISY